MIPREYVVRLGSFSGDGPYVVGRDGDDWTISFSQRHASRWGSLHAAEFVANEFGDARPVRLVRRGGER